MLVLLDLLLHQTPQLNPSTKSVNQSTQPTLVYPLTQQLPASSNSHCPSWAMFTCLKCFTPNTKLCLALKKKPMLHILLIVCFILNVILYIIMWFYTLTSLISFETSRGSAVLSFKWYHSSVMEIYKAIQYEQIPTRLICSYTISPVI